MAILSQKKKYLPSLSTKPFRRIVLEREYLYSAREDTVKVFERLQDGEETLIEEVYFGGDSGHARDYFEELIRKL